LSERGTLKESKVSRIKPSRPTPAIASVTRVAMPQRWKGGKLLVKQRRGVAGSASVSTLDTIAATGPKPAELAAAILDVPVSMMSGSAKLAIVREISEPRLRRLDKAFRVVVKFFGGDREEAANWMGSPAIALNNQPPAVIAATPDGLARIEALLDRLAHGIPA
jgi:uncharacterized protein (DUF2384 family)